MARVTWRTLSIKSGGRKSVGVQFRWPMEAAEFDGFIAELQRRRSEFVDDHVPVPELPARTGSSRHYVDELARNGFDS